MRQLLTLLISLFWLQAQGQQQVNPVMKNFGGIYEVPDAVEKPNPNLEYKIVIDLAGGSDRPGDVNMSLINVARLVNLHSMGGVPKEKMHVVVAVHNDASYSIMNNESYREKYKTDNPNLAVYAELQAAGVRVFICGQSLQARNIDRTKIAKDVSIATSMLTVLSTYQLQGYAWFKF